jgi:Rod binding domain-containing protein
MTDFKPLGLAPIADSAAFAPPLPRTLSGGLSDGQRSFASVLSRAGHADQSPEQKAREAAEQLVAITFVQPLFKQLRSTSWAAGPFKPGPAEQQFRALLDADLSQRMVKSSSWGLVERLARDMLKRSEATGAEASGEKERGA